MGGRQTASECSSPARKVGPGDSNAPSVHFGRHRPVQLFTEIKVLACGGHSVGATSLIGM